MNKLKKLVKTPILLSLLLGVFMYILYTYTTDYTDRKNKQIFINKAQVDLLEETFRKTWNRNPTEYELKAQVENLILDEVFFKEAVAMGLDKTDPAVKRRLRQIMELMLDDFATIYPTENQLRKYLSEDPEKFREDPRISFRHLYFPLEEKEEAINLLPKIQKSNTVHKNYNGGLLLIPSEFEDETKREIERLLGKIFTQKLFELELGKWQGPVQSAYGWHLVKVSQRIDGIVPDLNTIWDIVEREWLVERKKKIKEEQYKFLKAQYEVTIENYK